MKGINLPRNTRNTRKNNNEFSNNNFVLFVNFVVNKFKIFDILVTFLCIAGMLFCVYFFYKDLHTTLSRFNEQPIGTITFRYNTAQRRFIDRLMWDRLQNGSLLYNGDVIRTADLSEATIAFVHGDIVNIFANTIIQIFEDSSGSRLDFSAGNISVNALSDSGLVITAADNRVTVDSGSVIRAAAIEAEPNLQGARQELIVAVSEGNAVLESVQNTNESVIIEAGSALSLSADGETIAVPQQVLQEFPTSRIAEVPVSAPELISPQNGQRISYTSRPPQIRFLWAADERVPAYILTVADNPSMENPIINTQVRSTGGNQLSFMTSARGSSSLGAGQWYWRVTGVFDRRFTGTAPSAADASSAVQSFLIERGSVLAAPVLIAPSENAILNIETGRRDILFSWQKENEAASYTIRISANRDMSSPAIEQTVRETHYRYRTRETSITAGTWYWTVQQTGMDGQVSAASLPRPFTAMQGEIVQRAVFPPDRYTVADNLLSEMRFTWKTNLSDTRFQVSSNSDFNQILIDEAASAESYNIRSLPSGEYFWRITGNINNQQMESTARRFTVAPALPPPVLETISGQAASQGNTVVLNQGQPLEFSWRSSPDTEYYAFQLVLMDDENNPVYETIVYEPRVSINMDEFEGGSFVWTVQGLTRESSTTSRRTGLAATQPIHIRQLTPISLDHPRSGREYSGVDASRRPDTARWSSQNTPYNTEFILARDAELKDIVFTRSGVSREVPLGRLPAGNYYWTVRAKNSEGLDITPLAPSHFRVLPIAQLPVVQNRLPANGHTITAEQISVTRKVDFSWNRVSEANGYILTVFQGEGANRKTVIQTPVLNTNSYTVEDIAQLGRGAFFWQVEAVYVLEGGFIEQRGRVSENRLTVDIPAAGATRPRDTGAMYGN